MIGAMAARPVIAARRVVPAPVVLVAHGSRDPRSAATMRALAAGVAAADGGRVEAAFLDFNPPSVPAALRAAATGGVEPVVVVVPALLTHAYHGRVDLPEILRSAGIAARITAVLGPAEPGEEPHPLLLTAVARRLSEVASEVDGIVLMAAGTSSPAARSTVELVGRRLGDRLNVGCRVGYATASGPTVSEALRELRAAGARNVAAASYFLAPGRLYDAASDEARSHGAIAVAGALGAAPELMALVRERVSE
jgi:sirohydrochlorin ferrochelatase